MDRTAFHHLPRPRMTFVHDNQVDFDFLWDLTHPEGQVRLNSKGDPVDPAFDRRVLQDVLEKRSTHFSFNPPCGEPPWTGPGFDLTHIFVSPNTIYDVYGDDPELVQVAYLKQRCLRFLSVGFSSTSNNPLDVRKPQANEWVLDNFRWFVPRLRPSFGFGFDEKRDLETDLVDPRARAWPLMYLGPEMVRELGERHVRSTHAHWMDFDVHGGCWMQFHAFPFVRSVELDNALGRATSHLGLPQRYPENGSALPRRDAPAS